MKQWTRLAMHALKIHAFVFSRLADQPLVHHMHQVPRPAVFYHCLYSAAGPPEPIAEECCQCDHSRCRPCQHRCIAEDMLLMPRKCIQAEHVRLPVYSYADYYVVLVGSIGQVSPTSQGSDVVFQLQNSVTVSATNVINATQFQPAHLWPNKLDAKLSAGIHLQ